ncbi:ribulose-phosphate 3-epimerase [Corynebacterium mendelii]|uniref:Ribulose-phosphate 3-epimerase n=1 Tax=Corynebacterium mendelii TaxID=2765362 RepID=A0A939IT38_9CORY|nr:ribulose-phosphate 3-epimerase [Corynebacterium mendelii]MBN9643429.1 ribulose-phosphate 3-epimerase [Corynebacterium mendelii]
MRRSLIAPSILSADFSRLADELDAVSNADWIHVDIMDNHFVPNLTFGVGVTEAVHASTDIPLDVHLMIDDPARWAPDYVRAGAHTVVFHVEALAPDQDFTAVCDTIRQLGARAGISVKPGTPIEDYLAGLDHVDEVLVMSVEPGFGGQAFMPEVLGKVRALRSYIDSHGLDVDINIDGGISRATIAQAAEAGCDAFVAGSAVYGADDPNGEITVLRELADTARGVPAGRD